MTGERVICLHKGSYSDRGLIGVFHTMEELSRAIWLRAPSIAGTLFTKDNLPGEYDIEEFTIGELASTTIRLKRWWNCCMDMDTAEILEEREVIYDDWGGTSDGSKFHSEVYGPLLTSDDADTERHICRYSSTRSAAHARKACIELRQRYTQYKLDGIKRKDAWKLAQMEVNNMEEEDEAGKT